MCQSVVDKGREGCRDDRSRLESLADLVKAEQKNPAASFPAENDTRKAANLYRTYPKILLRSLV